MNTEAGIQDSESTVSREEHSTLHNPHTAIRNRLVASDLSKWLFKILKLRNKPQQFPISDFRYTIYEPVAASHRHPRSGFPKQKEGTIKHAILRNEAKFREGLFFKQVAVRQAIVRDFWSYFRRAILKNEANLSIYDCRLPICDLRTGSGSVFTECRVRKLKQKSDLIRLNPTRKTGARHELPIITNEHPKTAWSRNGSMFRDEPLQTQGRSE
jgi:hypothetical protein